MNEFAGRFERNSAKVRWTTDQLHINLYVVDLHQQNLIHGDCQSVFRLIIKKIKRLSLKSARNNTANEYYLASVFYPLIVCRDCQCRRIRPPYLVSVNIEVSLIHYLTLISLVKRKILYNHEFSLHCVKFENLNIFWKNISIMYFFFEELTMRIGAPWSRKNTKA